MSNKYHQRHALRETFATKAQPNQFCQYVWLDRGELQHCFAPTEHGHTYCAYCDAQRGQSNTGSKFHSVRSVYPNL